MAGKSQDQERSFIPYHGPPAQAQHTTTALSAAGKRKRETGDLDEKQGGGEVEKACKDDAYDSEATTIINDAENANISSPINYNNLNDVDIPLDDADRALLADIDTTPLDDDDDEIADAEVEDEEEDVRPLSPNSMLFTTLWTPQDISHPLHKRYLATLRLRAEQGKSAEQDKAAKLAAGLAAGDALDRAFHTTATAINKNDNNENSEHTTTVGPAAASDTSSELSSPPDTLIDPDAPPKERERVTCTHTDWCECPVGRGVEMGAGFPHLGSWALSVWADGAEVSGVRSTIGMGKDGEGKR